MEILKCTSVIKEVAGRELFQIDQLHAMFGQKIGLVGDNGTGKSTFLKLLIGEDTEYHGKILLQTDWAYVPQLKEDSHLSGGEQVWKELTKAFSKRACLLILDEPTANLDTKHQAALVKQLKHYRGTVIIVSHDRYFLNQVVEQIWHLEQQKVTIYQGNYDDFVQERKEKRERHYQEYQSCQEQIKKLRKAQKQRQQKALKMTKKKKGISQSDWKVNAMMGSYDSQVKSMAKSAKQLEKRIERLEKVEQPRKETWVKMEVRGAIDTELHRLFRLKEGQVIIEEKSIVSFPEIGMKFGDKVAIVGDNGSGKTSFVKQLLSQELLGYYNPKLRIAYFAQDLHHIDEEATAFDVVYSTSVQDRVTILNLLAMLGIPYHKAFQKVGTLSGGEKVRLSLAKVLLSDANLLILDEPTNFLDITTLEALETFLVNYPGSLLLISHDAVFVDRVTDYKWIIEKSVMRNEVRKY